MKPPSQKGLIPAPTKRRRVSSVCRSAPEIAEVVNASLLLRERIFAQSWIIPRCGRRGWPTTSIIHTWSPANLALSNLTYGLVYDLQVLWERGYGGRRRATSHGPPAKARVPVFRKRLSPESTFLKARWLPSIRGEHPWPGRKVNHASFLWQP